MYYITTHPSPVGELTLASEGASLMGLWLAGQKYHGQSITGPTSRNDSLPVFTAAKQWLERYFAGEAPESSALPLAPQGSEFRQLIWRLLCEIPYGQQVSYGELARRAAAQLGRDSMASRAVGGAVGHNPISIIIPCHRVIGANGSLTGYAGGIEAKTYLLQLESTRESSTH